MPRIFKMQPNQPEILLTIFKGMPPRVDVLFKGTVKFSYICALLIFFQSMYIRGFRWFLDIKVSMYCEGYSSYRLQDLKFKISEGSDQNWSCPESAQLAVSAKLRQLVGQTQDNFNFGGAF